MCMKKAILLTAAIIAIIARSLAYVDESGKVSTQYILNYETGEKTYFDLDNWEDVDSIYKKCSAKLTYINDETGATIEWTFHDGVFYNLVVDEETGEVYVDEDAYFWENRATSLCIDYAIGRAYPHGDR